MAARSYINDSATWRELTKVYINDSGTWRDVTKIYINDSATWREVFAPATNYIFNDTITSSQGPYNVNTEATTAGWNGTDVLEATITINASVKVKGNALSGVAGISIDTGTAPASSTCDIINSGDIWGGGGTGANGYVAGTKGGTAINFQYDGSVLNNSGATIRGGSGGGGSGGMDSFTPPSEPCDDVDGGTGGGGWPNGLGPGTADPGTESGGGNGGGGASGAGDGGNGGGQNTLAGLTGDDGGGNCSAQNSSGLAGGAAGDAIDKNGNTVTVTDNGTISGSIVA